MGHSGSAKAFRVDYAREEYSCFICGNVAIHKGESHWLIGRTTQHERRACNNHKKDQVEEEYRREFQKESGEKLSDTDVLRASADELGEIIKRVQDGEDFLRSPKGRK